MVAAWMPNESAQKGSESVIDRPRALIVRSTSPALELQQVNLRSRGKDEAWLRDRLFEHPEVLPVAENWGQFAPLIPLGTEIASMDALFVSPGGYLTIVETKLVDNPEDRRRVLAQVIDYARNLSTWSTEELARQVHSWSVSKYNSFKRDTVRAPSTTHLYEYVRDYAKADEVDRLETAAPEPDSSTKDKFLKSLKRNLEHARFLLLVVGERDLVRVQDLTETIQASSFLQFSLALLEIATFELPGEHGELLLVPRVVLRTDEIGRSVARLEVTDHVRELLKVSYPGLSEVESIDQSTDRQRARPITDLDFFDHLQEAGQAAVVPQVRELVDFLRNDERIALRPTSTGISARLPNPRNSSELLTLFWLDLKGINFYYLRLHARRMGLPEFLVCDLI